MDKITLYFEALAESNRALTLLHTTGVIDTKVFPGLESLISRNNDILSGIPHKREFKDYYSATLDALKLSIERKEPAYATGVYVVLPKIRGDKQALNTLIHRAAIEYPEMEIELVKIIKGDVDEVSQND